MLPSIKRVSEVFEKMLETTLVVACQRCFHIEIM
jgi:hypothetical protein